MVDLGQKRWIYSTFFIGIILKTFAIKGYILQNLINFHKEIPNKIPN